MYSNTSRRRGRRFGDTARTNPTRHRLHRNPRRNRATPPRRPHPVRKGRNPRRCPLRRGIPPRTPPSHRTRTPTTNRTTPLGLRIRNDNPHPRHHRTRIRVLRTSSGPETAALSLRRTPRRRHPHPRHPRLPGPGSPTPSLRHTPHPRRHHISSKRSMPGRPPVTTSSPNGTTLPTKPTWNREYPPRSPKPPKFSVPTHPAHSPKPKSTRRSTPSTLPTPNAPSGRSEPP